MHTWVKIDLQMVSGKLIKKYVSQLGKLFKNKIY